MAENISKLYRKGLWYEDKEKERFEHVKTALLRRRNREYDVLDLAWHIKNAVIGGIYISQDVYSGIESGDIWNDFVEIKGGKVLPKNPENPKKLDKYEIISDIINGKAKLNSAGVFDGKYLEIRKWTGNDYSKVPLIFEHVVPAKLYLDELIRADIANEFDENYFREFRKNILVCIVTKAQNERLNKWKNSMPILKGKAVIKVINKVYKKDDWLDVTNNIFNRYNNVDPKVIIHGLNIK